jgi:nicotinamide-nucleotide amidase
MLKRMRAEIVSVGTEILLGEILDTNTQYLSARLPGIGLDLYFHSTVGDNLARVVDELEHALKRSDVIIMTGGLGPTEDDLTREAVAEALGEQMFVDEDALRQLRAFFEARGFTFPERNKKQAMLIPSARSISNPRGTAPGWWVETTRPDEGDRIIIAMPGPPAEMQRMWEVEVEPKLVELTGGQVLITRTLKTVGVGESTIDEMISPLLSSSNPSIGVYAKADGVHVRLAAKAETAERARALIQPTEEEARRILGEIVWGVDDDTLEGAVGSMLRERGMMVATMESCTGGLIASTLTDVEGSSAYFKGGYVAYTAQMKRSLGVSADLIEQHGVISSEVASDMARAARHALEADFGIGVTGVAGHDEVEGHPPGTMHIAVHDGTQAQPVSYTFFQGREATKRRAVTTALLLLRRGLLARR